MANLTLSNRWADNVRQIEPGDPVSGGPSAPINLCLKNLGDRTEYLKTALDNTVKTNADSTTTGIISINRADSFIKGVNRGQDNWYIGSGSSSNNDVSLHSFRYSTTLTLKNDRLWANKDLYINNHKVFHAGNLAAATDRTAGIVQLSHNTDGTDRTKAASEYALGEVRRMAGNAQAAAAGISLTWNSISGKPSRFTPDSHTHAIADITGLQTALNGKAASSHTHTWAQITGVPSASTGAAGIVQLSSATNSAAENQAATPKAVRDALANAAPAGMVAFFAMTAAPAGWLKANGAAVSRTQYATLFAAIGTTFGAGDGRTTFNLPDLRGEFVRGLDDGRNIDSGRRLGVHQGDAIRNITGNFWTTARRDYGHTQIDGVFNRAEAGSSNMSSGHPDDWASKVNLDASRQVPTANENRPRNHALLACIKYL